MVIVRAGAMVNFKVVPAEPTSARKVPSTLAKSPVPVALAIVTGAPGSAPIDAVSVSVTWPVSSL